MKRLLAAVLAACCMTASDAAPRFDPFAGPQPLVVLVQDNPWLDAIGSDTPRVAIYENGEVIYQQGQGREWAYRHSVLNTAALDEVRARLRPVQALRDPIRRYIVTGWSDQPTAKLYLHDGAREAAFTVYGLRCRGAGAAASWPLLDDEVPAVPQELSSLHRWLCDFDTPNSTAWQASLIEVMLWDYSYAPQRSIAWPKEWPSLDSERARPRGDSYSVFLDARELPALRTLLARRKPKGAIAIQGHKMVASWRFTFPSEPVWRRAIDALSDPD